jgi:hypothetical protein
VTSINNLNVKRAKSLKPNSWGKMFCISRLFPNKLHKSRVLEN